MTLQFQPYREPLRVTLLRTGAIAVVIGGALARSLGGRWPIATLIALWPALGGHFVEIFFLNFLRPRLAANRAVRIAARLVVWFVGGVILALAMGLTARAVGVHPARWTVPGSALGLAGVGFIGIELVVHLVLQIIGQPSFYNGRG